MGWKRRKRRWLSRRRRILGEVNQPREKSKVVAEIAIRPSCVSRRERKVPKAERKVI